MSDIVIFANERNAGLELAIRANTSVAYHRPVSVVAPFDVSALTKTAGAEWAKATNQNQVDLHYLSTILVTTGWNLNDDVFDQAETFLARSTPEDKPFNYEHDCADIIGHITACRLIGSDLLPLADDVGISSLPSKFHVQTGAVLYKVCSKPELQQRMDAMLPEIAAGEWFVSMEALFHGFDYGVQSADGTQRVVARNEQTAFLTKYLRAYGGTGSYEDYRIGRVLRSIVFCGKGLVRKPANPESVILADPVLFDSRTSAAITIPKILQENSGVWKTLGYSASTAGSPGGQPQDKEPKTPECPPMPELDTLQQTIADLRAENTRLTTTATEAAEKAAKATVDSLQMEITSLKASVTGLTSEKDKLIADLSSSNTKLTETTVSHKAVSEELSTLKAVAQRTERIQTVSTQLKTTVEAATKLVDTVQSLNDVQFAAHVELMASTLASLTPVVVVTEASEEDDSAEVDDTALEGTTPETTSAALVTTDTETDAGVETVRASIASFFTKTTK